MPDDGVNVTIDFSHRISLIRYLGKAITPARLKMQAEVFVGELAEEIDFDITFAKIKFWFETVVARSVVFCRSNTTAMEMLLNDENQSRVVNHLMITPHEPTDEHLAALFQSKMGAFAKGQIEFGCVRMETDDGGLLYTYVGDWHEDLPTMEDWFKARPYYFEQPWWQRDDASSLDLISADADFQQLPSWAYRLDFIDNAIRPKATEKSADEVVIRGAFRPKVINGGRDDE